MSYVMLEIPQQSGSDVADAGQKVQFVSLETDLALPELVVTLYEAASHFSRLLAELHLGTSPVDPHTRRGEALN